MAGLFSWTIFTYMLLIGFVFAIVTFVVSFLGGLGEGGGDVCDASDVGSGGTNVFATLLPLSPLVWCIFLLIAGVIGEVMTQATDTSFVVRFIVAIPTGYLIMLLFNKFVFLPMKNAKNYANREEDLLGAEATVFERISEGQGRRGAVRVKGPSGSVIYTAVSKNHKEIKSGTAVRVVFIENKVATVLPDDAFFDDTHLISQKYMN